MVVYKVMATKDLEYGERKVERGVLFDVTPNDYMLLNKQGKVSKVISIFEKRETAVKRRKISKA